MEQLNPQNIEQINVLGDMFRQQATHTFEQHGIAGQATGMGSLANLHFTNKPLNDARDSLAAMMRSGHINQLLHLSMLQRGVASASRLMYCTSTAMTRDDVTFAVNALDDCLRALKPGIVRERPDLLLD